MKIFIKTLLFVFITLITNIKVVLSANVAFLDIQETTTFLSFHKETPKTVFMVIENDWVNRCQNERDLVAYRGWGTGVADDAAKGGYGSFNAFKSAFGSAGKGNAWHHIVEQGGSNVAKFGAESIHNVNNLIKLPHGAGSIHAKVSGFYSSKQAFTGGQTVRQWLGTQ